KYTPKAKPALADPEEALPTNPANRVRDEEHYLEESEYRVDPVEFNLNSLKEEEPQERIPQGVSKTEDAKPELTVEPVEVVEKPVARNVIKPAETEGPSMTVEAVKEEKEVDKATELVQEFGQYDPKLDLSGYQYPGLHLLNDYGSGKITINNHELEENKDKIVDTLGNYNIEIDKIKATIGPTVTLYEIIPKPGVRISRIKNLEDDIALSLAALGIRIIAPMPGKGTIGIEVPNSNPEMVSMRSVLATEKFQHTDMDLPIALGKTISNEVYIADLSKM